MRTFEQYINEASQKYIFGGTDDRNTDVKLKVWANIKKGDKIYVWRAREESKVSLEKIIDIEDRQTKKKIDAENCLCFIDNDELDSDAHCIIDKYSFCITTNFDALQNIVKEVFDKDITEENIREFGVKESKKNYIFGGTDDRNTDVNVKIFAELEKGDKIFYWNKGWRKDTIHVYEIVSIEQKYFSRIFIFKNNKLHIFDIENTLNYTGSDVVIATTLDEIARFIHDEYHIDADSLKIKYS